MTIYNRGIMTKIYDSQRKWKEDNRERISQYKKDWLKKRREMGLSLYDPVKRRNNYLDNIDREKSRNNEWHNKMRDKYGFSTKTMARFGLKTALEVYDKYNRKCAKCDVDYDLTIHHIDHNGRNSQDKGEYVNNDIDNLILLCRRCHGRLHSREYWSSVKGTVYEED